MKELVVMLPDARKWKQYDEMFAKRMSMAGIRPDDRIGLAVSGGPDSMGLCVLAERWCRSSGADLEGLRGLVVDHGLRNNSGSEATFVQGLVSDLGIRCEVLRCSWPSGIPPQGHLQEDARNARYGILQRKCEMKGIPILITAHHSDDQAELFIIRLSRKSGIPGLAGMPFVSDLVPRSGPVNLSDAPCNGVLLIRPLLDFTKQDLKNVCLEAGQNWVEDPTNTNPVFARSRIRKAMESLNADFKKDVGNLMALCRRTREQLDRARDKLLCEVAYVSQEFGFVTVDLKKLSALHLDTRLLFRALGTILQYVGQREKPPRGRAVQSLLDRLCKGQLQAAFTAGGCFVCAAPGSKGHVVLFTWSPDCPEPASATFSKFCSSPATFLPAPDRVEQEVLHNARQRKSEILSNLLSPVDADVNVLGIPEQEPDSILDKGKSLGLISNATMTSLMLLIPEISKDMEKSVNSDPVGTNCCKEVELGFGQTVYVWKRFSVTISKVEGTQTDPADCILRNSRVQLRPFQERDWLHLSVVANHTAYGKLDADVMPRVGQVTACRCGSVDPGNVGQSVACDHYVATKAQEALHVLKRLPTAVRRSLPVLLSAQGLLLAVPSIGYQRCRVVSVSAKYLPMFPLGGRIAFWK